MLAGLNLNLRSWSGHSEIRPVSYSYYLKSAYWPKLSKTGGPKQIHEHMAKWHHWVNSVTWPHSDKFSLPSSFLWILVRVNSKQGFLDLDEFNTSPLVKARLFGFLFLWRENTAPDLSLLMSKKQSSCNLRYLSPHQRQWRDLSWEIGDDMPHISLLLRERLGARGVGPWPERGPLLISRIRKANLRRWG